MIDAFICTNLVNYTVALHGPRPGVGRRALLLYERARIPTPRLPGVWPLAIHIGSLRLLRWLAALGFVHTLYVPHHRFNKRVSLARRYAREVAYLDDGLDTCRRVPRNFELDALAGGPRYHTFAEYRTLPPWLSHFDVRRETSLLRLADTAQQPTLPMDGVDHVLVESPGMSARDLFVGLGLDPTRTLVVRHPIASKRGAVPAGCHAVEGQNHSLEASMLGCRGKVFYFGETMALVFAALSDVARHNRVYAQLSQAQRDNLVGLRWLPTRGDEARIDGLRAVAID